MNTTVKDWYIVAVMDGEQLVGEVLYGTVVEDATLRFYEGDYVTTSLIIEKDFEKGQILTTSHSLYLIEGCGKQAIIDLDDFELLRNGFSPEQIKALNSSSPLLAH